MVFIDKSEWPEPDFLNEDPEDPRRMNFHFSGADGATYRGSGLHLAQPFLSSSHMGDTEMHGIKNSLRQWTKIGDTENEDVYFRWREFDKQKIIRTSVGAACEIDLQRVDVFRHAKS